MESKKTNKSAAKRKAIGAKKISKVASSLNELAAARPEKSPARGALYRFGLIHKEISLGGYPSSMDLGEILEVSYKTVLRDIGIMRDQFGFPIQYDATLKGFYYDIEFEQSSDILYWNSIFSRMKDVSETGDTQRKNTLSSYLSFLENSEDMRKILNNLLSIIHMGGSIIVKRGASRYAMVPLSICKRMGEWYAVFASDRDGMFMRVNVRMAIFEKNHMILVADSADYIPGRTGNLLQECNCDKHTDLCVCAIGGMLRSCTRSRRAKAVFMGGA